MTMSSETYESLESRLRTILPEEYQDCYDDVQPVSMGSAGLKYGSDGKVAWDEIWGSFCDLAMAGGPPHKGSLLEPASREEINAQPDRYEEAVDEICRGIVMVTDLGAEPSRDLGWVQVDCTSVGMTGWLTRAIIMENVVARFEGMTLYLPAGPRYRIEKEIKNVVTVIAKTCHYWLGHTSSAQHRAIANLFAKMEGELPLVQPALSDDNSRMDTQLWLSSKIAKSLQEATGLLSSNHQYNGWLGLECSYIRAAIWMMRALVASNVLSRREGTVVFIPINPARDPNGETVVRLVTQIHHLAVDRKIFK